MSEITNRIPIDKGKVMQMFCELPYPMQISLLAGLHAGLASCGGSKGGTADAGKAKVSATPC